jgi:hypothetical protein
MASFCLFLDGVCLLGVYPSALYLKFIVLYSVSATASISRFLHLERILRKLLLCFDFVVEMILGLLFAYQNETNNKCKHGKCIHLENQYIAISRSASWTFDNSSPLG